jgi:hypothetical protein
MSAQAQSTYGFLPAHLVTRLSLFCLALLCCADSADFNLEQLAGKRLIEAEYVVLTNILGHGFLPQHVFA